MKTFKQVLDRLNAEAISHPEWWDLPVVHTDGQCGHTFLDGYVFVEEADEWPDEYALQDDIEGRFVRIT